MLSKHGAIVFTSLNMINKSLNNIWFVLVTEASEAIICYITVRADQFVEPHGCGRR